VLRAEDIERLTMLLDIHELFVGIEINNEG